MPALNPNNDSITLEEYENLPSNVRAEVFDGHIYNMASPSQKHQTISMELSVILNQYIRQNNSSCKVFAAPFDVKLSNDPLVIVQPDLMIIRDKNKLDGKRCNGAPDFIIEIISPGKASDDYIKKLYYYQKYGVREYWIVDPTTERVFVNDFENGQLNIPYTFDDTIKVGLYDHLYIDFSEIKQALA